MGYSSDDLSASLLYRDIAGAANTPMGAAMGGMYNQFGLNGLTGNIGTLDALTSGIGSVDGLSTGGGMYGGIGNTNLLGGVTMHQGPLEDEYQSYLKRQQKDMNFLKKTMLLLGGLIILDFMGFKGLKKVLTKKLKTSKLSTKLRGWWSKATSSAAKAVGSVTPSSGKKTFWQKLCFWK